jgi:hypothetical protein
MSRYPEYLHPNGAGGFLDHYLRKPAPVPCDVAALRPIRAVLSTHDYWQLAEHRRRCEDLGGTLFMRLARLIRAKMADADIVDADALVPEAVTGASRVSFALGRRRPETRTLYHWGYPDKERSRLPVGTFLGVTLIGMSAGQRMRLLNERGVAGEVQVLAVRAQYATERVGHD